MSLSLGLGLGITMRGGASAGAADLSFFEVTGAQTSGDLPVDYTIDRASVVYIAFVATGGAAPSAAQIEAGSGGGIVAAMSDTWTVSGTDLTEPLPSGLDGAYDIYVTAHRSGVVLSDTNITIDTTAASLSSPTSSNLAATTATVTVTCNTTAGTLYAAVYPTASTPSAADIIAGTGATWSGNDATPNASTNDFSATGLTASTNYKAHFVHRDAQLNTSSVSTSAQFSTTAAPSLTTEYVGETHSAGNVFPGARTFSGVIPNDASNTWTYYVFLQTAYSTTMAGSVTIAGGAATLVDSTTEGSGSSGSTLFLYKRSVAAGSGAGDFVYDLTDFVSGTGISVFRSRGGTTENVTKGTTNTMGATISLNQNTATTDDLIAGCVIQTTNTGGGGQVWTGLTSQHWDDIGSSAGRHSCALNTSPAGGSPMTLSVRPAGTDVGSPHACAMLLRIS
jgi:hypothetical protein